MAGNTLPTFDNIPQAEWDRLLAAFGNAAGYKTWLRGAIRDEVTNRELHALEVDAQKTRDARTADLATFLDAAT